MMDRLREKKRERMRDVDTCLCPDLKEVDGRVQVEKTGYIELSILLKDRVENGS